MAQFFVPPVALIGETTLAAPHPGNQLFKHFTPRRVGLNVYLMPGNVLTQQDPEFDTDAVRVFHGGHVHEVNATEAALLTAGGYTVVTV
jgi:hypothetical protein